MAFEYYSDIDRASEPMQSPFIRPLHYRLAKRLADILLSLIGLFCFSPLLIMTAVLIRLFDGKGPVLFRQTRNGMFGKSFTIFKFRTMTQVPQNEFEQCKPEDSRISAIGKILRKTSIDELPQLVNILLGDMSIVGPRPHPLELDKQFGLVLPNYMDRYLVRPGLTGWAQILGRRGPTPTTEVMAARLEADLEYVKHNSLIFDILIIFRTIPAVLYQNNAH